MFLANTRLHFHYNTDNKTTFLANFHNTANIYFLWSLRITTWIHPLLIFSIKACWWYWLLRKAKKHQKKKRWKWKGH